MQMRTTYVLCGHGGTGKQGTDRHLMVNRTQTTACGTELDDRFKSNL